MEQGRYLIKEKLGAGGMGEVHRAHDRLLNQTVALKQVLVPPDFLQFNTRTEDVDLMLALAREFKALASLRHPNIISVLDYGFTQKRIPFFTMEYLANPVSILNAEFQSHYQHGAQLEIDSLINTLLDDAAPASTAY